MDRHHQNKQQFSDWSSNTYNSNATRNNINEVVCERPKSRWSNEYKNFNNLNNGRDIFIDQEKTSVSKPVEKGSLLHLFAGG